VNSPDAIFAVREERKKRPGPTKGGKEVGMGTGEHHCPERKGGNCSAGEKDEGGTGRIPTAEDPIMIVPEN